MKERSESEHVAQRDMIYERQETMVHGELSLGKVGGVTAL